MVSKKRPTDIPAWLHVTPNVSVINSPCSYVDCRHDEDGNGTTTPRTNQRVVYLFAALGSLIYLIQPIGCFIAGTMQVRYGKKRCMIISNAPSIAGWTLLYFAQSPKALYASSLLMGFSVGFSTSLTHPYVSEITEPRLRGVMASLLNTAMFTGQTLSFALALFFEWRTAALLSTTCPALCVCFVLFIPESPIWLIIRGDSAGAERSLCWLRGWTEPEVVRYEFQELVHYSRESGTCGDKDDVNLGSSSNLSLFKDPLIYKPFKIMIIYSFVAFIVSVTPARPFLSRILTEAGLPNHQNVYCMILSTLQGIASIILSLIVHRLGKRFLTLLTVSINSILLTLLGLYILAIKNDYIESILWIPLILLCSIYFFGACGVSCIVWMLLGEIFPNKRRGFMTGLCTGIFNILLFILTKSFLTVVSLLSMEYTMILFGSIGIVGIVYFYFYLPETENKTLLEIEKNFLPNSKGHV